MQVRLAPGLRRVRGLVRSPCRRPALARAEIALRVGSRSPEATRSAISPGAARCGRCGRCGRCARCTARCALAGGPDAPARAQRSRHPVSRRPTGRRSSVRWRWTDGRRPLDGPERGVVTAREFDGREPERAQRAPHTLSRPVPSRPVRSHFVSPQRRRRRHEVRSHRGWGGCMRRARYAPPPALRAGARATRRRAARARAPTGPATTPPARARLRTGPRARVRRRRDGRRSSRLRAGAAQR